MPYRFHGDAFLFRLNERSFGNTPGRIRYALFEHVPGALLGSHLLHEMMVWTEWKVEPNGGNVVKLGFFWMLEQQEKALKWKQEHERAQNDGKRVEKDDTLGAIDVHTGLPNQ